MNPVPCICRHELKSRSGTAKSARADVYIYRPLPLQTFINHQEYPLA